MVNGQRRLFFITVDNKFYEAFAGETVETAGVILGEWCSNDPKVEQNPVYIHLVFSEVEQDGTVTVTPYVNRQAFGSKSEDIVSRGIVKSLPIPLPFPSETKSTTQNITFNLFGTVASGWKIGCYIEWSAKAKLTHISLSSESQTSEVSQKSKPNRHVSISV